MILNLSESQAEELRQTLEGVLGDMSSEIADTDNPSYRLTLKERRDHLRSVRDKLAGVGQAVR